MTGVTQQVQLPVKTYLLNESVSTTENYFCWNFADDLGGVLFLENITADITVTDSKFLQNMAGTAGGAAYALSISGDLTTESIFLFQSIPDDMSKHK